MSEPKPYLHRGPRLIPWASVFAMLAIGMRPKEIIRVLQRETGHTFCASTIHTKLCEMRHGKRRMVAAGGPNEAIRGSDTYGCSG